MREAKPRRVSDIPVDARANRRDGRIGTDGGDGVAPYSLLSALDRLTPTP